MDHRTLCQFLDNPDHLVVSTSGRPWVLIESMVKLGMNKTLIGRHPSKSEENGDDSHLDDELTLVHHGSEEYRRAQQLRGLFIDFYNHEQLMLRRLVEEEKEVIEAFSSLQQC
ncbi:unnamed protein product [Cuscuta epithymum]|uniref:Uncharacterized protein n=1 Tax=Cuscuta epithymum TaxID=186058 RepID=A0AAV0CAM5_9ASTE|nr:unnamed protein product [Cuscuta epithymum]